MQKFDVVALGELLVDFTENGKSAQGNTLFEANRHAMFCQCCNALGKKQPLSERWEKILLAKCFGLLWQNRELILQM